jgi:hypothetical protein
MRSSAEAVIMDDFTLTMNCGYPSQDIIVGGTNNDYIISPVPDISHFVNEEVIIEDIDGATSSSDDGGPYSTGSHHEDDIVAVRLDIYFTKVTYFYDFFPAMFCRSRKSLMMSTPSPCLSLWTLISWTECRKR